MQTHLPSQTCKQLNVAVVGNSNSVMAISYSRWLATHPDISLQNFSIGGVPNILMLSFLADTSVDFSTLDYVILEPAVIEGLHLKTHSRYTVEQSALVIDVFMDALRAVSPAKVIFLILPITHALQMPQHYFVEQHYLACARRHGAAVLNGYEIVRRLGGLDRKGPPHELLAQARRFIATFGLDDEMLFIMRLWGRQSPRELHGVDIGTKAFCQHAFIDAIHISRVFHGLIGELLYRWMWADDASVRREHHRCDRRDIVMRSDGTPANPANVVNHESRLITRKLSRLQSGEIVRYHCGPDYRAVSIMVNEYQTSGYVNLQSPLGNASVDVRFANQRAGWNATIARIPGIVGGGEICATISDQPLADAALDDHQFLNIVAGASSVTAEVGELIVVKHSAYAARQDNLDNTTEDPASIEQAEWALPLIQNTGMISAQVISGISESFHALPKRTSTRILNDNIITDENFMTAKARVLAGSLAFDQLKQLLSDGLSRWPESSLLHEMEAALDALAMHA